MFIQSYQTAREKSGHTHQQNPVHDFISHYAIRNPNLHTYSRTHRQDTHRRVRFASSRTSPRLKNGMIGFLTPTFNSHYLTKRSSLSGCSLIGSAFCTCESSEFFDGKWVYTTTRNNKKRLLMQRSIPSQQAMSHASQLARLLALRHRTRDDVV